MEPGERRPDSGAQETDAEVLRVVLDLMIESDRLRGDLSASLSTEDEVKLALLFEKWRFAMLDAARVDRARWQAFETEERGE